MKNKLARQHPQSYRTWEPPRHVRETMAMDGKVLTAEPRPASTFTPNTQLVEITWTAPSNTRARSVHARGCQTNGAFTLISLAQARQLPRLLPHLSATPSSLLPLPLSVSLRAPPPLTAARLIICSSSVTSHQAIMHLCLAPANCATATLCEKNRASHPDYDVMAAKRWLTRHVTAPISMTSFIGGDLWLAGPLITTLGVKKRKKKRCSLKSVTDVMT